MGHIWDDWNLETMQLLDSTGFLILISYSFHIIIHHRPTTKCLQTIGFFCLKRRPYYIISLWFLKRIVVELWSVGHNITNRPVHPGSLVFFFGNEILPSLTKLWFDKPWNSDPYDSALADPGTFSPGWQNDALEKVTPLKMAIFGINSFFSDFSFVYNQPLQKSRNFFTRMTHASCQSQRWEFSPVPVPGVGHCCTGSRRGGRGRSVRSERVENLEIALIMCRCDTIYDDMIYDSMLWNTRPRQCNIM